MTTPHRVHSDPLVDSSRRSHERARAALADADTAAMDGVVWLSAHLTAMEHVVLPVMTAVLDDQREALERQRTIARGLHGRLRALEQRLAGDGLAVAASVEGLSDGLLIMLNEHARIEEDLIARLVGVLDQGAANDLARRYDRALIHGPTRPHPHGPRRGRIGRLVYSLDAIRDHVLDVLDSRHVPLPRQPKSRRELGRWSRYLLGSADVEATSAAHADPKPGRNE
jgi:hypothetical protein